MDRLWQGSLLSFLSVSIPLSPADSCGRGMHADAVFSFYDNIINYLEGSSWLLVLSLFFEVNKTF
jgi:hypothetical protein